MAVAALTACQAQKEPPKRSDRQGVSGPAAGLPEQPWQDQASAGGLDQGGIPGPGPSSPPAPPDATSSASAASPAPPPGQPRVPDGTPTPNGDPAAALALITEPDLKKTLTTLAGGRYGGRASGDQGNEDAADYIIDLFRSAGLKPGAGSDYRQTFPFNASGRSGRTSNIIGILPGTDPQLAEEAIVVGAHMDHLGRGFGGTIYYGADDNASGTSALIHLARVAGSTMGGFKRTVIFIAFSGEELGLLGSRHYVKNPVFPLRDTLFMINMDMIGYGKGSVDALGASKSQAVEARLVEIRDRYPDLQISTTGDAGNRSDHAPFFQKGIPVTVFHTGADHPHYHRPTDTADKVDTRTMTTITKVVLELMVATAGDAAFSKGSSLTMDLRLQTPLEDLFDFDTYFSIHGHGHEPLDSAPNHALLPGQPL